MIRAVPNGKEIEICVHLCSCTGELWDDSKQISLNDKKGGVVHPIYLWAICPSRILTHPFSLSKIVAD
jgi:hypothetical protein